MQRSVGGRDDVSAEISRALGRIEGQMAGFDLRLAEHGRVTELAINGLRQDVVSANTRILNQVADHEKRIGTLEDDKVARGGAFKFIAIAKDYSPWVCAGLIGLVAYLK